MKSVTVEKRAKSLVTPISVPHPATKVSCHQYPLSPKSFVPKIRHQLGYFQKMVTMPDGSIKCPGMFTHFTNAYFFTSIVTTAIGYGAQEHIYINSKTFKAMTSIFTDNVLLLTL